MYKRQLVVSTENGYQVKMKKKQEFEVAVPEQEEKDGVLFVPVSYTHLIIMKL